MGEGGGVGPDTTQETSQIHPQTWNQLARGKCQVTRGSPEQQGVEGERLDQASGSRKGIRYGCSVAEQERSAAIQCGQVGRGGQGRGAGQPVGLGGGRQQQQEGIQEQKGRQKPFSQSNSDEESPATHGLGRQGGRGPAVAKDRDLYTILSLNARSVVNKIELLRVQCYILKPDFVFICETFANDDISDIYLALAGYEIISRRDGKDTAGGRCRGLLMYARRGLQASQLVIQGADICTECIGISVPWGKGSQSSSELLKFVMVYRPPKVPGSEADNGNTDRLCQALRSLGGNVVIFGDFNMPGIDWDKAWSNCTGETMLLDLMGDKFWHQIVRGPTHRDGNTLDLVIPSSPELIAGVETHDPLATSDHNMQLTTLVGPARGISTMEEVPDWSKADYIAIKLAMEQINWQEEFKDKLGQDCLDLFYDVVKRETERCIPKKLRRKSNKPLWIRA